jgi:hypothetical protein
MKKQIGFILILCFFLSNSVFGQEKNTENLTEDNETQSANSQKNPSFSVQANPLLHLLNLLGLFGFELEFQYAINDYLNISINPQFSFSKSGVESYNRTYDEEQMTITLTPGILFRPFKTRLRGMYAGIYMPVGWENITVEGYTRPYYVFTETEPDITEIDINDNFMLLGIGTSIGYQWVFNNGFTISLGVGGQKVWQIESKNNTGEYLEKKHLFDLPFDLTLAFRLGYSF